MTKTFRAFVAAASVLVLSLADHSQMTSWFQRTLLPPQQLDQIIGDGWNSALDIKKLLDTQNRQETGLEGIRSHLQILKSAGWVTY